MDIWAVSIIFTEAATTDLSVEISDVAFLTQQEAEAYGTQQLNQYENPIDYHVHKMTITESNVDIENIIVDADIVTEQIDGQA